MNKSTISVCIITFNQKDFIKQCIQSALNQETDYEYEIIINDDCSQDDTSVICEGFAKRYPDKVKYFRNNVNLGIVKNWIAAIQRCNGKYIAICEGDDYWTDKRKLQYQAEFLDNNSDYALCFHQVYEEWMGKVHENVSILKNEIYTIEDLAKGNIINTPSVFFRSDAIQEFPDWYIHSPVADYILYMLVARQGKIKYLPISMAVYRRHTGTWSNKSSDYHLKNWINVLKLLLRGDFNKQVIENLSLQLKRIANEYFTSRIYQNDFSFLKELEVLSYEYPDFGKAWLLEYYPNIIVEIKNSKSYKFATKLSGIKNKVSSFLKF